MCTPRLISQRKYYFAGQVQGKQSPEAMKFNQAEKVNKRNVKLIQFFTYAALKLINKANQSYEKCNLSESTKCTVKLVLLILMFAK